MMRYLHIDCEMGSRELKYSLLTAYFMVTDETFNVLGELELNLKPDDGCYIVSGQGMSVNKINLQEHDKIAISYKEAKPKLYQFLTSWTFGSKEKLIPVGHGVRGDIAHVIDKLISEGSWNNFCTYHYIDTSVVLQFLRACNLMDRDCDGSVEALANYFKIEVPGDLHIAKNDTVATMKVFEQFVNLVKTPISA